jgi:hypothetical protein
VWECAPDHFLPYVGGRFIFRRPPDEQGNISDPVELELIEVRRYAQHSTIGSAPALSPPGTQRDLFSLLFVLQKGESLGKGLHQLIHETFEPCDLFLSRVAVLDPGRAHDGRMYYEAVFG